ncbi:dehydrogenase/reductase SDR family member 13 isoform X2 [Tachyglossus aculeatus]|uniref:dehydrogenase/reductase SDR family member 13 isoform X2 n=1 Tax=Tachyglossus aculeatus TaxID=9261 RepID=UPI0018F6EA5F|nr:dehydrogenase/reductase SDR family member 13 isoform X2 [Tachyglossus aculeatus]
MAPLVLLAAGLLLGAYVLLYYNFIQAARCTSPTQLSGKTAVVTGSNAGIGKMIALALARRGARVVLACRSKERAEAAVYDIRKTGNQEVIFMRLDLADLQSVRAFAGTFLNSEPRLDILVHNAGISSSGKSREKFNLLLRVNHVGAFLLSRLLLARLRACAPSRVVVVASAAYRRGRLDFARLDQPVAGWRQELRAYADSKLANVLYVRELATRLEGTGVTCYAAHPGPVNSELYLRHVPGWLRLLLIPLAWLLLREPAAGAQTPVHCAVQEGIEPLSGRYFSDCCVEEVRPHGRDDAAALRLWEASERLAGLAPKQV